MEEETEVDNGQNAVKPVNSLGSFGAALIAMNDGKAVYRHGWNGKGMFLYLVPAASYPSQTEVAKKQFGETVPYQAYIAMKTVDGTVVPWLASQTDMLAFDWFSEV